MMYSIFHDLNHSYYRGDLQAHANKKKTVKIIIFRHFLFGDSY